MVGTDDQTWFQVIGNMLLLNIENTAPVVPLDVPPLSLEEEDDDGLLLTTTVGGVGVLTGWLWTFTTTGGVETTGVEGAGVLAVLVGIVTTGGVTTTGVGVGVGVETDGEDHEFVFVKSIFTF